MQSLYGAIANYKLKRNMVRVDDVYQKVLAIANKEQRGYITPQEFNLLANQAQMSIFESYFYIKNQRERGDGEKDQTEVAVLQTSTSDQTSQLQGRQDHGCRCKEGLENIEASEPQTAVACQKFSL